jgi:peptide subunit release factor 1 (eRF1)
MTDNLASWRDQARKYDERMAMMEALVEAARKWDAAYEGIADPSEADRLLHAAVIGLNAIVSSHHTEEGALPE